MNEQTLIDPLWVEIAKSLQTSRQSSEAIAKIVNTDSLYSHLKDMQSEGFIRHHDMRGDWQLCERGRYLVWLSQHPNFNETLALVTSRINKIDLQFFAELLFGTANVKLQ